VTFNASAAAESEPSSATARNDLAWFQSNDIAAQFMAENYGFMHTKPTFFVNSHDKNVSV
jgi:hypothetical protein